jgi:hypothetical protein
VTTRRPYRIAGAGRGSGPYQGRKAFKMARIDDLEKRIEALEERLDLLTGKPRGPISMTEYRLACERKDKAMIQRYLDQFKSKEVGKNGTGCGDSTKT